MTYQGAKIVNQYALELSYSNLRKTWFLGRNERSTFFADAVGPKIIPHRDCMMHTSRA